MNNFSKYLKTDPKKYSLTTKRIIFCVFMCALISFSGFMAVQTFIRGSENLEGLTHVRGKITSNRIMKSKHESKYRTYDEDVLVISIEGCDDELGFMEDNTCYVDLTNLMSKNRTLIADVYYDKSRKRIEQNVTLHTFDLKINEKRYIQIEDIKKSEWIGSLIFSLITLALIWLTYIRAKKMN